MRDGGWLTQTLPEGGAARGASRLRHWVMERFLGVDGVRGWGLMMIFGELGEVAQGAAGYAVYEVFADDSVD